MRLKYLTIGFIVGILLATAGTSLAAPVLKKVTATIRADFGLQIDGEVVQLENAPLAYNGTSYLPVRELSTLLGKDVDFEDGTITLTTKEEPDLTEWIGIRDYALAEGVELTLAGDKVTISSPIELTIQLPEIKSGEKLIQTDRGDIRVKFENGLTYFNLDDLKAVGAIQ